MKKMYAGLFVTLFVLTFSVTSALAQCDNEDCTSKSGIINGEIWTVEDSPICVDGDISVENLTIEPGVAVEFCGEYTFEVTGTLKAIGNAEAKIEFRDGSSAWKGMKIRSSARNCELNNCIITGSNDGGLDIISSTPVIRNVYISKNTRESSGAGMYILLAASSSDKLVIENSTISNNTSRNHGGGIYADLSAGSMVMRNCRINNNTSTYTSTGHRYGGGIYANANGGLKLEGCEISGNQVNAYYNNYHGVNYAYGGGFYFNEGNVECKNCIIRSNQTSSSQTGGGTANSYGAGIFCDAGTLQLKNCIISSNSNTAYGASRFKYGGGIYNRAASVNIENCTIVSNVMYGIYNNNGVTRVANSIIYFNNSGQVSGTISINHSDIQGGFDGEGNIDQDPLFKDVFTYQVYCDYSPCVDTGNVYPWHNDSCFPPSCGDARNDMGAYGGPEACGWCAYGSGICLGPCETPSVGDFNKDGDVDGADLFLFLNNFGRN